MKTSDSGLELIKRYEGLKLTPYLCSAGVPTIGYGSTFYQNRARVKLTDPPITLQFAEQLLIDTVAKFERHVEKRLTVSVSQNQFDALVSHTFNTGGSDTLFRLINQRADISLIEDWWTSRYITANGKQLQGLIRRRREEYNLYAK